MISLILLITLTVKVLANTSIGYSPSSIQPSSTTTPLVSAIYNGTTGNASIISSIYNGTSTNASIFSSIYDRASINSSTISNVINVTVFYTIYNSAFTSVIGIQPTSSVYVSSSSVGLNLTFGNLVNNDWKLKVTFKLNEIWNNDLSDKTSSAYTTLKTRIVTPFDTYFQGNKHYRVTIPQNITETVNDGSSIIAVDLVVYIKTWNLVNIQSEVTPMMFLNTEFSLSSTILSCSYT